MIRVRQLRDLEERGRGEILAMVGKKAKCAGL